MNVTLKHYIVTIDRDGKLITGNPPAYDVQGAVTAVIRSYGPSSFYGCTARVTDLGTLKTLNVRIDRPDNDFVLTVDY